jgi:hypothetical protein
MARPVWRGLHVGRGDGALETLDPLQMLRTEARRLPHDAPQMAFGNIERAAERGDGQSRAR